MVKNIKVLSPACGSVQCLDLVNEIYLIGWGMKQDDWAIATEYDLTNHKILSEIVTDKEIVSYRTLKIE